MNSIIVTGGLGFIGSNFIRMLLSENLCDSVLNVDKQTYAGNPENLIEFEKDSRYQFLKADIGDTRKVESAISEFCPSSIINFAAESHVDRSIDTPEPFVETNVLGTLRLLQASRNYFSQLEEKGKNGFRFLHVSTDEVYGSLETDDPAFCETTPYAPNSPYSASKAGADHLVRSYHHTFGLPTLTTNCSNNYGPFQFPEKLIPNTINCALNNKKIPIYGNGKQIRDWLYVEDHCSALREVLKNGTIGEVYNIGGECEKANIDVVNQICTVLDDLYPKNSGNSYKDQITFVEDRLGHDFRYAIDTSKIKAQLDWGLSENFDTGIKKTIQWYLDNKEWVKLTLKNQ